MEIRGGDPIAVPCRWCGRQFLKVRVDAQPVPVICPDCGNVTVVVSRQEEGRWKVYSSKATKARSNH